jgi:DnaJ-class molecular chaperone
MNNESADKETCPDCYLGTSKTYTITQTPNSISTTAVSCKTCDGTGYLEKKEDEPN